MSKATPREELTSMPERVLLDIARNDSAQMEWRKAAIRLLLERGVYPPEKHAELTILVQMVKQELDARAEVEAIVEAAVEGQIHPENEPAQPVVEGDGPFRASVTTKTLQQPE